MTELIPELTTVETTKVETTKVITANFQQVSHSKLGLKGPRRFLWPVEVGLDSFLVGAQQVPVLVGSSVRLDPPVRHCLPGAVDQPLRSLAVSVRWLVRESAAASLRAKAGAVSAQE